MVGGSELVLDRPHKRRGIGAPQNEGHLLRTEWRATTLVGRDDDLAALARWRDSDPPIAVRCITGRAGSGKTRLAIEACEAAEEQRWTAGFVSGDELRRFDEAQNLGQRRSAGNTLIVVDEAAASVDVLKKWFTALARRLPPSSQPKKLRILLLERHADADSDYGWWAELKRSETMDHAGAGDLIGAEQPMPLATLARPEERRALLAEVMRLAAEFLGKPAITPPAAGADPDFDRHLADDQLENEPLFLVMAGIVAVDRGAPAALTLGRIELAKQLAAVERARLARLGASRGLPADGDLIAHLAACLTLQRGCDPVAAGALVNEEIPAMGYSSPFPTDVLVDLLADALPGPAGAEIDGVRPDLIGEAFLISEVVGRRARGDVARLAIIERARRRSESQVLETLVLSAQDFAGGASDHPAVHWLTELANRSAGIEELAPISDAIPPGVSALCELGAAVDGRLAELVRGKGADEDGPLLAFVLTRLGDRLDDLGNGEAALAAAQEAVGRYRILAAEQPGAFNDGLARSLTGSASFLNAAGRHAEALAPAREAVDLLRAIAPRRLALIPDLARSLDILANVLSENNEHEAALEAAQQAVDLTRLLARVQPDAFNDALTWSLGGLASRLNSLGHHEAAVAAGREAVGRCRTLAAEAPDTFNPNLAASLSNLAISLRALDGDAALAAAQEAVELLRALAAARPAASRPALARSLANLGAILYDLGRHEAALAASREAIEVSRALAEAQPDAADPGLARLLNNLAAALNQLPEPEEALVTAREAVERFRAVAAARPDMFDHDLAAALSNLANSLYALDHRDEARAAVQEAVELQRRLAAASPASFSLDLTISLSTLAYLVEEAGRLEDALALRHEAVAVLAPCFLASPARFADPMRACALEYLRRVEAAGMEPDLALIEPIKAKFKEEGEKDDAD